MEVCITESRSAVSTLLYIPNEILEKILECLLTEDLLRCRLVSKLFKTHANRVCRRHHVSVKLQCSNHGTIKWRDLFSTFRDWRDLPWSGCSLEFRRYINAGGLNDEATCCKGQGRQYCIRTEVFKKICKKFGSQIRSFKIGGDSLEIIVNFLQAMPNLEVLISTITPTITSQVATYFSRSQLKLNKLKHLVITIRSVAELQLLKFFNKIATLSSIDVSITKTCSASLTPYHNPFLDFRETAAFRVTKNAAREMSNIFEGIPNIVLNFSSIHDPNILQTLTVHGVKYRKLYFQIVEGEHPEYYQALENLLTNSSKTLVTLSIRESQFCPPTTPLQIPILPKLKEFIFHATGVCTCDTYVKQFISGQFPSLEKLKVVMLDTSNEGHDTDELILFKSAQHNSIKELILDNRVKYKFFPMATDWAWVCPNLRRLTVHKINIRGLKDICQGFPRLEHLYLTAGRGNLSQYEYSCDYCPETIICRYPRGSITNKWGMQASAWSLASLKCLRTLTLDFKRPHFHNGEEMEKVPYPEPEIHLALLKLHRLDTLIFRNIEISTDVRAKLAEYHRQVEVLNAK